MIDRGRTIYIYILGSISLSTNMMFPDLPLVLFLFLANIWMSIPFSVADPRETLRSDTRGDGV